MKRLIQKFSLCAVSLVISSCSQRVANNNVHEGDQEFVYHKDSLMVIKIDDELTYLDVDNVIDTMEYIKLETRDESLIGSVAKVVIENQKIFLHDRTTDQIKVFKIGGDYLYSINNIGKGPKEYMKIHDFLIKGDSTLVYDNLSQKILIYDENGSVLETTKAMFNFKEFKYLENDLYVYAVRNYDNKKHPSIDGYSLVIGTLDSVIHKGIKNNKLLSELSITANNTLLKVGNAIRFTPFLSNAIYSIDRKGEVTVTYDLQYPNSLPRNYFEETKASAFDRYVKNGDYTYFMGIFTENAEHMYLRLTPSKESYRYALINKKNMESIYFDAYTNSRKFLGYDHPITVYGNHFVSIIQPSVILQNNHIDKIEEKIGHLTELENPVIILYQYKQYL